jgi:4-amino-4-deoxy-L-arabinose transferase-like glycosyltransferase
LETAKMRIEPAALRRWLLSAFAVLALFFSLGGRGLNEPDEGRYAEIGREMAATGDWLTPRLNGVPHLSKPPLTYWLIGLSIKGLGATEFAARLPAALAALGTLLGLYLLTRSALGEATALLAVLVLLSSPLFFVIARLITTDMLLTCFVTWSVWTLWRWYDSPDRAWRKLRWFYIFLGLGVMTKGPVAVVLPLMALSGLRWKNPDLHLRKMQWARGALMVLVITVPWFIAVAGTNVEVWKYFLGREMVGRVISSVHHREEAWWYFIPVLAGGMLFWLPWLLMSPVGLRGAATRQQSIIRLCLAWAGLGLMLFTMSRSKLATYALPLLPPLAVLATATLTGFARKLAERREVGWGLAAGAGSLVLLVGLVVTLTVAGTRRFQMDAWAWLGDWVLVLSVALVSGGLLIGRKLLPASAVLGVGAIGWFMILSAKFPALEYALPNSASLKPLARRVLAEDPSGQTTVIAYQNLPPGLVFYLGRMVLWFRGETGVSERNQGIFEYRTPQTETATVVTDPNRVAAMLAGLEPAFCVVRTRDAAALAGRFSLTELARHGRYALLSNHDSSSLQSPPLSGPADGARHTSFPAESP